MERTIDLFSKVRGVVVVESEGYFLQCTKHQLSQQ